jgi:mannan endo-1,4-beta-mannosidase
VQLGSERLVWLLAAWLGCGCTPARPAPAPSSGGNQGPATDSANAPEPRDGRGSPGLTVDPSIHPVTPNASPEAVALLQFLYSISGKAILAGQHCVPLGGSTRLAGVYKVTGRYPAVFGQDFGFSEPGTWDGINFRQQIVDDAIRRHDEGFVIVLMWHAVRPIEDEPVTFEASVQGKLTDREWRDLLTPGTDIHERWESQVDVIAWHLAQLKNAGVPVIWRPYHEMNGGWFWWGKKSGDSGYKQLYRMLFDRLVRFHGLDNLLWVYGANELGPTVDPYDAEYPGSDVVDILATDVYHGGFARTDYEALSALAGAKPIALAEVGAAPPVGVLEEQPRWAWFMTWHDPSVSGDAKDALRAAYDDKRTWTLDRLPWVHWSHPRVHYPVLR